MSSSSSSEPKFEGRISELKGYVYDCHIPYRHQQADQYHTTTEKLAEYFTFHVKNKNAGCMHHAILQLQLPEIPPPVEPPTVLVEQVVTDNTSEMDTSVSDRKNEYELVKFEINYKSYYEKVDNIQQLNMILYAVIMSQCSRTMRIQLEMMDGHTNRRSDGVALLRSVKDISYNNNNTSMYKMDVMNQALIQLLQCRQTADMSTMEYYKRFRIRRDVYEYVGGSTTASPGTLVYMVQSLNLNDVNELSQEQQVAAREHELAALFIQNANRKRYEHLQITLHNDFLFGNDTNPTTLSDAYNLLVNWKDPMHR